MSCDHCEESRADGMRFCPICGEDLREDCPECGSYREAGKDYCGGCGRRLRAPVAPVPEKKREPTNIFLAFACTGALLTAFVLVVESGFMIVGFGSVWSWCGENSMNILGLVPNLVVLTTIDGLSLQIAWTLIFIAVLLSLGYVAVRSYRIARERNGRIAERIDGTDICTVGRVFAISIFLDIVIVAIMAVFGETIDIPEGMPTGTDPDALLSFADAAVWEEVIARVVPIGIPMTVAMIVMKRGRGWTAVLGGFGLSKLSLALILISALMFGFAHESGWGITKVFPTFVAGLLFGYLYAKVGIHASIAVHFLTDYLSVVTYSGNMGLMTVMSFIVLAFLVIGAVCAIEGCLRMKGAKKRVQELPTWVPDESESIFSRRGSD